MFWWTSLGTAWHITLHLGCLCSWGYPNSWMVYEGKILLKWMIRGYPDFGKPAFYCVLYMCLLLYFIVLICPNEWFDICDWDHCFINSTIDYYICIYVYVCIYIYIICILQCHSYVLIVFVPSILGTLQDVVVPTTEASPSGRVDWW